MQSGWFACSGSPDTMVRMGDTVNVCEIFLSIQGEGVRTGRPCTLIRLAGCSLRCNWCDAQYAWEPGEPVAIDAIIATSGEIGCPLVEVTGGEPLDQPGAHELLRRLCDAGFETLLETSGARDVSTVDARVVRIIDVKCPSSGQTERMCWANLDAVRPGDEVKFVIADRADYDFAAEVMARYDLPNRCTVLMGAVSDRLAPAELAEWILANRLDVRLQVQLHRIVWPDRRRGV